MDVVLTIGRDPSRAEPYAKALRATGLTVHVLSSSDADTNWIQRAEVAHGLVLCGGGDIDPASFTPPEAPHPTIDDIDDVRDRMEYALFHHALQREWPVLGVCRGFQVMNWALGGTLIQDIDSLIEPAGMPKYHRQTEYGKKRGDRHHRVEVVQGTLLSHILGDPPEVDVNSIHHQALGVVSPRFIVNARSMSDDVVEGIEMPDRPFVLGVQWHPECLWGQQRCTDSSRLFQAFAGAVVGQKV